MPRLSQLSRSIAGRIALVTGAASGMGRATAHLFADEGAKVAVCDLNEEGTATVVKEIRDAGGEAVGLPCDVADRKAAADLVERVVEHFGGLQILVNNAGISPGAALDAPEFPEVWDRTLAVNLTAHVELIRAALPHLQADGAGRIVNIASTEGLGATAGIPSYTASKHGVVGLTKSLAVQLGAQGVTVNCVCPGPIRTGMTAAIPDPMKEKFARRRVPARRYGEPEEVAHATLSLVLPAASFINGAILPVDGGLVIQNT
ncbi:MAG: SDR family oxidoreductase [Deltaproteobacteria bacterium]|nr:SDR family oxidoreductase [Deltaproteobacteria bacterium]MBW2393781.1 SDR family oxidoreductase [Deltaproteobacteria bacterium]